MDIIYSLVCGSSGVAFAIYINVLNYSCINKPAMNVWTENVSWK